MIVFPQLNSGAGAQYPVVRRRRVRSAVNHLRDGSIVAYADPSYSLNAWEMALRDLTDAESEAIQDLFRTTEGRKGKFTFVDPTANLLAYSEDLGNSRWSKGPLVQMTTGIDDPFGGQRAIRLTNAAQTVQTVSQLLSSPAWFQYAFSVYARSAGETSITLARSASSASHARRYVIGPGWTRCVLSGALSTSSSAVRFGIEMPTATAVDVFGIQVEAQPCASAYKPTVERDGIYSNARFDDDVLQLISDGPDQHRFRLRIVAKD